MSSSNTPDIEEAIARSSLGTPDAVAMRARTSDERARAVMARAQRIAVEQTDDINWTLLQHLAGKPHKHLNIVEGEQYGLLIDGVFNNANHGVGEVMEEARAVQHLCDMAGVPEGEGYHAHIDARVFRMLLALNDARGKLARIGAWHARETADGGMVGDYCVECGNVWPCDTRRLVDGTFEDES
jgi:hypothetical protein